MSNVRRPLVENYLALVSNSKLPIPVWALAVLWVALLGISDLLLLSEGRLSARQGHVKTLGEDGGTLSLKVLVGQLLSAGFVFGLSAYVGGGLSVFLAGGWLITAIFVVSRNARSVLFVLALSKPGAAQGLLHFSRPFAVRGQALELFAGALLCLCLGLLVPHLALLGASLLLAATALGFVRKSHVRPDT